MKKIEVVVKSKRPKIWHRHIYDEKLITLFRKGLTDEEIGEQTGFSKTTIETHRARLGLSRRYGEVKPKPKQPPYLRKPEPEPKPKHGTGVNPDSHLARAKSLLREQGRLDERHGAIYLDGKLVRYFLEIVTEANRIRKQRGECQIGPHECHV